MRAKNGVFFSPNGPNFPKAGILGQFPPRAPLLRISTLFLKENGVLAPMPHLGMLGFGCPLWAGAAANAPQFKAHPTLGAKKPLDRHASWPKTAKNRQNVSGDKKQPTPRPKWERTVSSSNQLQEPARNTCGHVLARFWPPGRMQQARGLAQ